MHNDSQATTPSGGAVASAAPRTAGRYEICAELARGGMASVYLARREGDDRDVALKELTLDPSGDAALAERFALESQVASRLSHPNVVKVYDCFESGGRPYIAMEYLDGGSLRIYAGRLSLEQIARALEDVLAGLTHIEAHGVVHRDIKPDNLLVSAGGRVKIADFGIAKACGVAPARLTAAGRTVGTPAYMAPEQAMGRAVGPGTDLYSVGVVAYELLVGELPFKNTDWSVLIQHINEPVPAPRAIRPDLDPALERWLLRLLEKDPLQRPASAQQAWRELDECLLALRGPHWRRAARLRPAARVEVRPPLAPQPERHRGERAWACACVPRPRGNRGESAARRLKPLRNRSSRR
jgi:serine/threonine protein kinase